MSEVKEHHAKVTEVGHNFYCNWKNKKNIKTCVNSLTQSLSLSSIDWAFGMS